jgi:hypothetical protein
MAPALHFGHDVLNRRAVKPAVAIAGVVAGSRSIYAEEARESIQAQFALQNRQGMPLEILIGHPIERDHGATS